MPSNGEKSPPGAEPPFGLDTPIKGKAEDKLGRAPFAQALSRTIDEWAGSDSLVIGLYGAWGSGKTSIKNMAIEALRDRHDDIAVLDFNPWEVVGHTDLRPTFFAEIGRVLGRSADENAKKTAQKWAFYAATLASLNPLVKHIPQAIQSLLLLAASSGMAAAAILPDSPKAKLAAVFVVFVISVIGATTNFLTGVITALTARAQFKTEKTIGEIKKELAEALATRAHPVIIFIDDIDRLDRPDVRAVFQLVKANGDLPRLVYVLLFQREIVEVALSEGAEPEVGRRFLEKVVQVPFDVPAIEKARVDQLLFSALDSLFSTPAAKRFIDQRRFGNLYYGGLSEYFDTLRAAYRFLASFRFHLRLFQSGDALEVNPLDVMAMEVLRVFEPQVFDSIRSNRRNLVEPPFMENEEGKEARRAKVQGIRDLAPKDKREAVESILVALFPEASFALGHGAVSGNEERLERQLRVCRPIFFDRYFAKAVPLGDVSQQEVEGFLAATNDGDRLREVIASLETRGLLEQALERLDAYRNKIPPANAPVLVKALFDVGDRLPPGRSLLFSLRLDATTHAGRLVYRCLMRQPEIAERERITMEALKASDGLNVPKWVLVHAEQSLKDGSEEHIFDQESLERLKQAFIEKTRGAAASGALLDRQYVRDVLTLWRSWGTGDEFRDWLEALISTPAGTIALVRAFKTHSESAGSGDRVTKRVAYVDVESLGVFIPLERLTGILKDAVGLSDEDEEVRTLYLKTIKASDEPRAVPLHWAMGRDEDDE